jgi:hypothetical protein
MMNWDEEFVRWMTAAYLYYWLDASEVPDSVWDFWGRNLKKNWDDVTHPAKSLVEYENMGSLHYISKAKFLEAFPDLPKTAAEVGY